MNISETGTAYDNDPWVVHYNKFVPVFPFNAVFMNSNRGTL